MNKDKGTVNYYKFIKSFKNSIKNIAESTIPILCIVFVLTQLIGSLGQIDRWDLLDQIATGDNFIKNGTFYPSPSSHEPSGVSIYFPGVAFLSVLLSNLPIGNYLIEFILLIASLISILFIVIQKKLLDRIIGWESSWKYFLPSIIVFSILLTNKYLFYAREFKPDTIALLLGYLGLFVAGLSEKVDKKNFDVVRLIIGGFLCGIPIIFKQQFIVFSIGILFYCIYFINKRRIIFAFSLIFTTIIALIKLFNIEYLYFWTVKVISDDGFLSIPYLVLYNFKTLISLLFVLLIGIYVSRLKVSKLSIKEIKKIVYNLSLNEFSWVILLSTLAAFASGLKAGGTEGNTQLGIFLVIPLLLSIFVRISNWKIIFIAWISIFLMLPSTVLNFHSYESAREYRSFAAKNFQKDAEIVLTGSNVYFASRLYLDQAKIINYWTMSLKNNDDLNQNPSLKKALKQLKSTPKVIFAENWSENKETLLQDNRYEIVYENSSGIIARYQ